MYAAEVVDGLVVRLIVGDAAWAAEWLGGVWANSEDKVGIGWTWDGENFVPPQPYPSWIWDNGWQPPIPQPEGEWMWDEDGQTWNGNEFMTAPVYPDGDVED